MSLGRFSLALFFDLKKSKKNKKYELGLLFRNLICYKNMPKFYVDNFVICPFMVNSTFYFIRRHVHSVIHDFNIYFPATISQKPVFLENTKIPVTPSPPPPHKKKRIKIWCAILCRENKELFKITSFTKRQSFTV